MINFIKLLPIKLWLLLVFSVFANLIANYRQEEINGRVLVLSLVLAGYIFWSYWKENRKKGD
ncbi:MAG: hypothetical protein JKY94_13680 [Rhodobacteraceae bacterium]|nr:hypothetical protein [Paracoccaceae bacterium]